MKRSPDTYEVYYDPNLQLLTAHKNGELQYLAGHVHTTESDGKMTPQRAVDAARQAGANALLVTDHNRIRGSQIAQEYAEGKDINVLLGSEVSSSEGHILALGIKKNVSRGRTAADTIKEIHDQDGIAIIPHMDLAHCESIRGVNVRNLLQQADSTLHPDGVEVFNGTGEALHRTPFVGWFVFREDANANVRAFHGSEFPLGIAFAGADAHGTVLNTLTGYKGDSPLDALRRRDTIVVFDANKFGLLGNIRETYAMGRVVAKKARRRIRFA